VREVPKRDPASNPMSTRRSTSALAPTPTPAPAARRARRPPRPAGRVALRQRPRAHRLGAARLVSTATRRDQLHRTRLAAGEPLRRELQPPRTRRTTEPRRLRLAARSASRCRSLAHRVQHLPTPRRARQAHLERRARRTDHRTPTTEHRPPNTDHRTPTTDHRPPTTDHRPTLSSELNHHTGSRQRKPPHLKNLRSPRWSGL
jgi:hypothetical protein